MTMLCYWCKHFDSQTDNEEHYCKVKNEIVGDITMGSTQVQKCNQYEQADYLCDRCESKHTCECAYDGYDRVINNNWNDYCLADK